VLNVMAGPAALPSDIRLGAVNLYASSENRWMLELMQPARRGKEGDCKVLPQSFIEKRLEAT